MTPIINVEAFKCNKCGHVWLSRGYAEKMHNEEKMFFPIACAKCKSAYWDREQQQPQTKRKKRTSKNKK